MTTSRTTLIGALIALALVAALVGHHSHVLTVRAHDAERARLAELRTRAERVDGLALSAGLGLLESYDALDDAFVELRMAVSAVERDALEERTAQRLDRFLARLAERSMQIEELKRQRAALGNSQRFVVRLLREPHASPARADPDALWRALLAWRLASDPAQRAVVDDERAGLAAKGADSALVARHLGVLLEAERIVDDLTVRFLRADLASAAADVAMSADEAAVARAERAARVDAWLLVASLALALGAAWWSRIEQVLRRR